MPDKGKPCCKNCAHCDFYDYEEDGEYYAYWDCELGHSCFDYDNGLCNDYE